MSDISWADGHKILALARQAVMASNKWEPALGFGSPAAPGDVVTGNVGSRLSNTDEYGAQVPGAPQMPVGPELAPGGWHARPENNGSMASTPRYGPHNPVLSDEDATTLHLVWSIMGIDGNKVGLGSVTHNVPRYDKHGKIVGWSAPIPGDNTGYFQDQLDPNEPYFPDGTPNLSGRPNPLGKPNPGWSGTALEQGMGGYQGAVRPAAPAPWGYTDDGRPLANPNARTEAGSLTPTGISIFAPGQKYGPFENKYAPSKAESDAQSHDKRMN